MSATIWKFPLSMMSEQLVPLPAGAEILCVQVQRSEPCLWARVDPEARIEKRQVFVRGTGHPLGLSGKEGRYVGTFQVQSGAFVFHVFEGGPA